MVRRYRGAVIAVQVNHKKEPTRFHWQGRQYQVQAITGSWVERGTWWLRSSSTEYRVFYRVEAVQLNYYRVEKKNYRVEKRKSASIGTYYLSMSVGTSHDQPHDQWALERVMD